MVGVSVLQTEVPEQSHGGGSEEDPSWQREAASHVML